MHSAAAAHTHFSSLYMNSTYSSQLNLHGVHGRLFVNKMENIWFKFISKRLWHVHCSTDVQLPHIHQIQTFFHCSFDLHPHVCACVYLVVLETEIAFCTCCRHLLQINWILHDFLIFPTSSKYFPFNCYALLGKWKAHLLLETKHIFSLILNLFNKKHINSHFICVE